MKRVKKRVVSLFLSVAMLLGTFVFSASATTSNTDILDSRPIVELQAVNQRVMSTDDGFIVTVDLVEDSNARMDVLAGYCIFQIKINSSNTGGTCSWTAKLSNGDFITGVKGKMTVLQDIFGPFNPVYAKMTVDASYLGTLYDTVYGSESFEFGYGEVLDEDENIIFEWYDFVVYGIEQIYTITNGDIQGEIGEFK